MDLPDFPEAKQIVHDQKVTDTASFHKKYSSISSIYNWSIPVFSVSIPPYQWDEEVTFKSLQPLTLYCAVRMWR